MNLMASQRQTSSKLIVAGLMLCALAVRLFRLDYQSLWTDEIISYEISRDSLWTLVVRPFDPNVPGLYYAVMHAVMLFGEGEWLLRLPSVCFAVLSVPLLYVITQKCLGRTTGLVAAALLTVSPFHIWYSQEARPYTLLLLLALLSFWMLQKTISSPHNGWVKIGFVFAAAALFYCHTVGIAFIGFLGIYALWQTPRQRWTSVLPLFGAVAVLIAPPIYRMLVISPDDAGDPFRSFNLVHIPYALWTFATGYSLGPSITELHAPNRISTLTPYLPLIVPVMLFLAAVFLHGAVCLRRKEGAIFWTIALWFAFPMTFASFGALVTSHAFNVRYMILSFPPFLILLAVGGLGLPRGWVRASTVGVLLLVSVVSLHNYYYEEQYHREDNRAAGRFLAAHAAPDDLVIACASYTLRDIQHYSRRDDLRMIGYSAARSESEMAARNDGAIGDREVALVAAPASTISLPPAPSADQLVADDLRRIVRGRPRVWLFLSRTYHGDPDGYLRGFFNERFHTDLRFRSAGVELIRFEQW